MRNFMKKKFTLLMASMMLLGATAGQAWTDGCCYTDPCCEEQTGFYVGGFGGANFISTSRNCGRSRDHFNTGYVAAASLGYRWCHDVRFEFEYAYRNNQRKHNIVGASSNRRHFGRNAYMFNGLYDINLCNDWCLKPFVGVGIGYEQINGRRHSDESGRHHRNGFAWQIIAGIAYPICDVIDLSLEYRFFKGRAHNLYNNDVGVGLKYYF